MDMSKADEQLSVLHYRTVSGHKVEAHEQEMLEGLRVITGRSEFDAGANRGESYAGTLVVKGLGPNFVRLRHLLAAHLAYCQRSILSLQHIKTTLTATDKAGIINHASSTAQEVQDWAQNARKAVRNSSTTDRKAQSAARTDTSFL
jgi:dethiobiotin synthetase